MNPGLIKTLLAAAVMNPCRIVKFGSADYEIIQATDGSAPMAGVIVETGIETGQAYASGDRVDVIRDGMANVVLGDTVARGKWLTADANGKAVEATIVAGSEVHVIGRAEVSGVAGDVIPMYVQPGVIATDTGIVSADVTITTGQLLALNATPKELVAAPGAGMAILVEDLQLFLDYNSVAYDGIAAGENLELRYENGSGALLATIETDPFLAATADAYRHVLPVTTAAHLVPANKAIVLCLASGEIATGNSPLKARIRYRTVAVAW